MAKSLKLAISSAKQAQAGKAAPTGVRPARRQGRYKDPGYRALSVQIPDELHRQIKALASLEGREVSGFVEDILRSFVEESFLKKA